MKVKNVLVFRFVNFSKTFLKLDELRNERSETRDKSELLSVLSRR